MDEIRVEITAGAGGPEAQAWASMVLKMYLRWVARKGYTILSGRQIERDGDGVKSATFGIIGDGVEKLLSENGIHRMVRNSPLDLESRRHTSFVGVDVMRTVEGHMVEPRKGPWGRNQIRSYVFDPYKIVKDLRTGESREDIDIVLDGDIDVFLDKAAALGFPHESDPNCAVMD